MKLRVLFGIFLIISLTACSSTKQTVISDEVIFKENYTRVNNDPFADSSGPIEEVTVDNLHL